MIEVWWTYRVREECIAEFERYYRAGGVWTEVFRADRAYRGTALLRDCDDPQRFATVDRWDSRAAYDRFMRDHAHSYKEVDDICGKFTLEETRIGCFEVS